MIGVGLTGLTGDKVMAGCVSQEAEEGVVRKVRREGGEGWCHTVSGSCTNIINNINISTYHHR